MAAFTAAIKDARSDVTSVGHLGVHRIRVLQQQRLEMPANKNKNKKRRRTAERPTTHPRNKYLDNPPDFALLASLYPSFKPFVFFASGGRPRIDWTNFNATRELTRVLLLHDHRLNWYFYSSNLLTFYLGIYQNTRLSVLLLCFLFQSLQHVVCFRLPSFFF